MITNIPLLSSNVTNIINIQYIPETFHMAQIVIEFDWVRDPKGYRLVESELPKMICVVRNGKGHTPEDFEHYQPLSSTDWLFKIFVNTATTPAGVLDFVQRFGPLTWEGWDARKGDPVNGAIYHADRMRQLLRPSSGDQRRPDLTPGSICSLNAAVIWDPKTKAAKWELRPNTLLDALWLQLGQALTGSAKFRQCEHCGDWFDAGRGTGRRLDAKFCSDEHRITFNSLKRSRENEHASHRPYPPALSGSMGVRYSLGTDPATGKRRMATTTVKGNRRAAEKELRRLLRTLDDGSHVDPTRITVRQWLVSWLDAVRDGSLSEVTRALF